MWRKRLTGLTIVGICLILIGATGSPEDCFRTATNQERSRRGIPRLRDAQDLNRYAEAHSARMAEDETIYHSDLRFSGRYRGENVGMGPDCESIQAAFMASPGHRSNVLDRDYTHFGVGVIIRDKTLYVTVDFAGRAAGRTIQKPRQKPSEPQRRPIIRSSPSEPRTPIREAPRPSPPPERMYDVRTLWGYRILLRVCLGWEYPQP